MSGVHWSIRDWFYFSISEGSWELLIGLLVVLIVACSVCYAIYIVCYYGFCALADYFTYQITLEKEQTKRVQMGEQTKQAQLGEQTKQAEIKERADANQTQQNKDSGTFFQIKGGYECKSSE